MTKQTITRIVTPSTGVRTNVTKANEGSPLLRLTGDEFATTAETPAALIATGACSREEPAPKLSPATRMSPLFGWHLVSRKRP